MEQDLAGSMMVICCCQSLVVEHDNYFNPFGG